MAISFGPKLGLLYNALIGESYFDSLRIFLQSIDALVQGSVINATQSAPPSSPNGGDAYLLTGGTPSGAWTGQAGNIAVWDAQLTNSGTNTVVPGWIFLTPKAGWTIWNVALGNLIVYNGSSWVSLTGGANFPTNTNITSMTGIPNTTFNSTGYVYNDGTDPQISIGAAANVANTGNTGLYWGTGNWTTPSAAGAAIIGNGPWTGTGYSGTVGIGVFDSTTGYTVVGAGAIYTNSLNCTGFQNIGASSLWGVVSIGSGGVGSYGQILARGTNNSGIRLSPVALTTLAFGIVLEANGGGAAGIGLVDFAGNYPSQTAVGAAGAASALPATPSGYLPIGVNGTQYVIPYYLP